MKHKTLSRIICYPDAPFLEIRLTISSERSYEMHAHPTLSIGFMLEGETIFATPKGSFTLSPGVLAIIEPNVQHTCNPLPQTKRSYVMVYLDASYCANIQKVLFRDTQILLPLKSPLIFHQRLYNTFSKSIDVLIKEYDALHVRALEQWLEEFLWLYSHPSQSNPLDSTLKHIALYIENRMDEPLCLKALSQRFEMNPFVLVRKFKHHFGCTPTHYWHDVRIHHAKTLLQEGMSLALCALHCGFVDQSHFHRFFKRRTAMTPKEYQVNFVQ